MKPTKSNLFLYNELVKELDQLYHDAAKRLHLSDCAFWILYCLRDSASDLTQTDICNILYLPKQTINSALKKMEEDGVITFVPGNDLRNKWIRLTENGERLAAQTVDRMMAAEIEALDSLTEEEQETFLALYRRFAGQLKQTWNKA